MDSKSKKEAYRRENRIQRERLKAMGLRTITVWIPREDYARILTDAEEAGRSLTEQVELLLTGKVRPRKVFRRRVTT